MITLKNYGFDELCGVNLAEVARYAGAASGESIPDSLIRRVAEAASARACYGIFDVTVSGDRVVIRGVGEICSRSLSRSLAGCNRAAVFGATLGHGVDRLIRRAMITSPSEGCVLGAIGSERAEALCNLLSSDIEARVKEEGGSTRPRFSPGYGDLPLEFQREIFRALDLTRNIGVSLGCGCIMTPEKTVTAIIGIEGGIK